MKLKSESPEAGSASSRSPNTNSATEKYSIEKTIILTKTNTHNTTTTDEKTSSASLSSISGATAATVTIASCGVQTPSLNKCKPISSRISRYQQHCQQAKVTSAGNVNQSGVELPNNFNSISIIEVCCPQIKLIKL